MVRSDVLLLIWLTRCLVRVLASIEGNALGSPGATSMVVGLVLTSLRLRV